MIYSMQITLLSIGKTKSQPCSELEDEYIKRIRGRFSCERVYVKNEKECLEHLHNHKGCIVLLDEHGSVMNSREFASFIDRTSQIHQHIVFVIGSAEGFPPAIRDIDADVIALSEMTFPHEIARVLLLEQLYRAQTIIEGHPYHK